MHLAKVKKWLKSNWVILLFFIIYLVVTMVVILFHENWEDEAQAWLTARDCSPIELIGRMKYEGHFLPWYFIIMPFAKLGLPFKTINIISWAISGVSAWLMLKHLPCKLYKRIIFIFTLPMVYLYPVIARCYCLIPLATILLIMFYKDRFKHPIRYLLSIVLMANTHIYCFMFAFILGLEFLIDWLKQRKKLNPKRNRQILIYIVATVFIVILSCLPLLGSFDNASVFERNTGIDLDLKRILIGDPVTMMGAFSSFVPLAITYIAVSIVISFLFLYRWDIFGKLFFSVIWQFLLFDNIFTTLLPQRLFIPIFFLAIFLFRQTNRVRPTFPCFFVKMFAIILLLALTVSSGSLFCEILTFVLIIFIGLSYPSKFKHLSHSPVFYYAKLFSIAILVLASIALIDGIINIIGEIQYSYSDSYNAANFIKRELLVNPEPPLFLTDTNNLISFAPVIANQNMPDFRIFNINNETFITYDPLMRRQNKPKDLKDITKYCGIREQSECYYIINYDITREAISELSSNYSSPTNQLVEDGTLKLIFDSKTENGDWNRSPTEHYRIYLVVR